MIYHDKINLKKGRKGLIRKALFMPFALCVAGFIFFAGVQKGQVDMYNTLMSKTDFLAINAVTMEEMK